MLKRAASHIKELGNQVASDVKGLAGSFTSILEGANNNVASDQGKAAQSIINKSPFEMPDSPEEAFKRDPLGFQAVMYPEELGGTELGHYMIFYSLANSHDKTGTDFKMANEVGLNINDTVQISDGTDFGSTTVSSLRKVGTNTIKEVKTDNSVLSRFPTHTRVSSAIALYMPTGIKVTDKVEYSAPTETNLAGTAAMAGAEFKDAKSTKGQIEAVLKGVGVGAADYLKQQAGDLLSGLNAGDPFKLAGKAGGFAFNPHEEIFFEKPGFRSFSYTFQFWPRNAQEAEKVEQIIKLFRYHMYPSLDKGKLGRIFFTPSEFEIHYMYKERENNHFNKISKCVLTDVDVTYGPSEQNSFFSEGDRAGQPVTHTLTLSFQELEFMTKQKVFKGY